MKNLEIITLSSVGVKNKSFNIIDAVNRDGCFNLQFRKDIRNERSGSPTYYRWKVQFVVTSPKTEKKSLEKIRKEMQCGAISVSNNQARFSVQKISDISENIIPYFRKNNLLDKKKKDFELWSKAVEIIEKNKGVSLVSWKKNDLNSLMQIHKSSSKYKKNIRQPKWLEVAKSLSKIS